MELFTQKMRDLWKDWELRLIVLLSLLLQTVLLVGRTRKSMSHVTLRVLVWCTYLTAESVAAFGLGVLSNRLANVRNRSNGQLDLSSQLMAFWAPFLLLHLGGPDVITAYSLEDNELWLRNLAMLVAKTGVAVYIYMMALTGSQFSILACVVIAIGFIKYAERILCLFLASRGHLRDSLLVPPDLGYPMIIERYQLKQQQGYDVSMNVVDSEVRIPEVLGDDNNRKFENEDRDIVVATEMFDIIKCLFVDLIRSSNDLESSKHLFKSLNPERAFRIVEIELLFMYELLYSKVKILSGYWGAFSRVSSVALFVGVLLFFKLEDKTKYKNRTDIAITYLLLVVSALIDLYLALRMLSNDWVKAKRIKNPNSRSSKIMETLEIPCPDKRWSGKVSQLSLIHFCHSRKGPYTWVEHGKVFGPMVEKARTHFAVTHETFLNYMKDWIYEHVHGKLVKFNDEMTKNNEQGARSMLEQYQATKILEEASRHPLDWSTKDIDFDLSILIWNIATEICYHHDWEHMSKRDGHARNNYRMSYIISKYMLYLLVMNPAMLPVGIGQLRYADALVEGRKYFEEQESDRKSRQGSGGVMTWFSSSSGNKSKNDHENPNADHQQRKDIKCHDELNNACEMLLRRVDDVPDSIFKVGGSKSEMLSACRLAKQLNEFWSSTESDAMTKKWKTIADIWAEALMYAAVQSSGTQHAKKLSEGGELLSHVWILMAHFGMSRHIRKSQGNTIIKIATQ